MTRRHVTPATAVVAALTALSLTGCTLSYDPNNPVFGEAVAVSEPIELITAEDADRLAPLTDAFTAATGTPVEVLPEASGERDWVEWDSSGAGSTAAGRQFWCVVADRAWFEINQIALPSSLDDLRKAVWAPRLTIDDPTGSEGALLWLTGLENPAGFLKRLVDRGAQLGGSSDLAHLRVDSALEPWRTVNNLQTSSRWTTLPETCVADQLTVSATGEAALAFVDYLLSPEGQSAMVEAGEAYPLDPSAGLPPGIEAVAPMPGEVPAADLSREAEVLRAWIAARAG